MHQKLRHRLKSETSPARRAGDNNAARIFEKKRLLEDSQKLIQDLNKFEKQLMTGAVEQFYDKLSIMRRGNAYQKETVPEDHFLEDWYLKCRHEEMERQSQQREQQRQSFNAESQCFAPSLEAFFGQQNSVAPKIDVVDTKEARRTGPPLTLTNLASNRNRINFTRIRLPQPDGQLPEGIVRLPTSPERQMLMKSLEGPGAATDSVATKATTIFELDFSKNAMSLAGMKEVLQRLLFDADARRRPMILRISMEKCVLTSDDKVEFGNLLRKLAARDKISIEAMNFEGTKFGNIATRAYLEGLAPTSELL